MIYIHFNKIIVYTLFLFSLNGCSQSIEREPPYTESDVLNDLVRSAPHQFISLDDIDEHEIKLQDEDIIFNVSSDELMIGELTDFIYTNDRFYVYDRRQGAVFMISMEGNISGPFTRSGAGPGEHGWVNHLRANSYYIYVPDLSNARINRFSYDMSFEDPLDNYLATATDLTTVELNNEYLLTGNQLSSGFDPKNPEDGLISISSIHALTDTIGTILPRIVPLGYQPMIYNLPGYSINNNSLIAASYRALPWIFIFEDDLSLNRTIILEYSAFEDLNTPKLEIVRAQDGQGVGGKLPINQHIILDNGDIFLSARNELIYLSLAQNGEYEGIGRYRFIPPDSDDPMMVAKFKIFPSEIGYFSGNMSYLFKFKIP